MDWSSAEALDAALGELGKLMFNSVPANLVLVNPHGTVALTNRNWDRFAMGAGAEGSSVGQNYLELCRTTGIEAPGAEAGLTSVLNGNAAEYACEFAHILNNQRRWFEMQITPLPVGGAIVAHLDITAVKLGEGMLEASDAVYTAGKRAEAFVQDMSRAANVVRSTVGSILANGKLHNDDRRLAEIAGEESDLLNFYVHRLKAAFEES